MSTLWRLSVVLIAAVTQAAEPAIGTGGALDGARPRVIVSTDIGGTDPDDFQSLVHLLLYADVLDIEGLISSPYGPGRKRHLLEVIDAYERDHPRLARHSSRYPAAEVLRRLTMQGETEVAPFSGVRQTTEGSNWIVERARANDARPLHVLVWGGIEDLAQALHDAPDILPKLRVYWIGGPNKKWSPDAYQYIVSRHPALWIIEANATYRGWFVGGDQADDRGNETFVVRHVAGHGALGNYFATQLQGVVKMGDTPSVARLLRGTPDDPSASSWGGRFVRAWDRPYVVFDRRTTASDRVELFAIVELALPIGPGEPGSPEAQLIIDNQMLAGHVDGNGTMRFRFAPRDPRLFTYRIRSNAPSLDGVSGAVTAVAPSIDVVQTPSSRHPNWWTDDPAPDVSEGIHHGARTVSQWRRAFLADFAERLDRAQQEPRTVSTSPSH